MSPRPRYPSDARISLQRHRHVLVSAVIYSALLAFVAGCAMTLLMALTTRHWH